MIRLAVRVAREDAPLALAELLVLSPGGVEEIDDDPATVQYVLYGASGELPSLPALRARVGDALVDVTTSEIADDWQQRWREFHEPVEVAGTLWVRAPWHDPPPRAGLHDVVIEPAQAFGTGAHATTRLCLELLCELRPGGPLVDLGCGSGVLAIAAAKLGFAPVVAVDHERESVRASAENAAANGVALEVARLDLRHDPLPRAPVVLANLLRPLLLELAARIDEPPRVLIASGLLREQADEVAAAFASMREVARRERGEWAALALERREPEGARVSLGA